MITVQKDKFLNAIKAVKTSVAKVALQPVLSTIHIKSQSGGLVLTTTDLETSSRAVCECNATEPIDVCINANALESIVARLNDLITLETNEAKVIIKSGKTKFELLFIQPDEFPQVEFNLTNEGIVIEKDDFVNGVNKAVISTSTDQGILSGVCFTFDKSGYELGATDGNRLSQVTFAKSLDIEGQFVIPRKILLDVVRNVGDEVSIFFDNKTVTFQTGTCLFKQNLLSGQFPTYNALVPSEFKHKAVIDKSDLLQALERVAVMCDERTNITVFDFKDGNLHLTTSCENGKAEDTIEVSFDGELKIAFNYRYILEGIKVMQAEAIEFDMNGELAACCINSDFTYLCMPVQLKGDK